MEDIIIPIWLFLPAAFSNMFAALSRYLKFLGFLALPVDMGITIKGQRLLGKNKTVRGFIIGTLAASVLGLVLKIVYTTLNFQDLFNLEFAYQDFNAPLFGAIIGFGALFGDSVESFFKRRVGIKPGEPWLFFDQTDYIFGCIAFSFLYTEFEVISYISIFLFYGIGHLLVKYVGFQIGLEDKKI